MQKVTLQIGLKKFLSLKKVKNIARWTYVIGDLNGKEIVGTFMTKNCKRQIILEFRTEKVIKRKGDKLYV